MAAIVIGLVIAGYAVFVIVKKIRNFRNGKFCSCCDCGCKNCYVKRSNKQKDNLFSEKNT